MKTIPDSVISTPALALGCPDPAMPNVDEPVGLSAVVSDADIDAPCKIPRVLGLDWHLSKVPFGSKAILSLPTAEKPFFTPDLPRSIVAMAPV